MPKLLPENSRGPSVTDIQSSTRNYIVRDFQTSGLSGKQNLCDGSGGLNLKVGMTGCLVSLFS